MLCFDLLLLLVNVSVSFRQHAVVDRCLLQNLPSTMCSRISYGSLYCELFQQPRQQLRQNVFVKWQWYSYITVNTRRSLLNTVPVKRALCLGLIYSYEKLSFFTTRPQTYNNSFPVTGTAWFWFNFIVLKHCMHCIAVRNTTWFTHVHCNMISRWMYIFIYLWV